jgi:hypothetical protein
MKNFEDIQTFCKLISDEPEFANYSELLSILSSDPKYNNQVQKIMSVFEETKYIKRIKSGLIATRRAAKDKIRQFELEKSKKLSEVNRSIKKSENHIQENISILQANDLEETTYSKSDEIMSSVLDEFDKAHKNII